MGILSWIVLGLIAGVIAKFILPGDDPGGVVVTALIGIAGGVIGGFVGRVLGFGDVTGINIVSVILAVAGAVILLIGYRMLKNRTA
ncbi:MAG: GlsB/YeaQ/YmgE family stress response membrane protein [Alphaproteobacteria bacterium]